MTNEKFKRAALLQQKIADCETIISRGSDIIGIEYIYRYDNTHQTKEFETNSFVAELIDFARERKAFYQSEFENL